MTKWSVCNLTEVNVKAFVLGPNHFDYKGFKRAVQLATRMGSRITNVNLWDKDWDTVQKRDRLLGVSLTGQVEAWDALGWGYVMNDTQNWAHKFLRIPFFSNGGKPEEPRYTYLKEDHRIQKVLSLAKAAAREEADTYHKEMGIPHSLLVTTVKPSGCRPWNALTTTDRGVLTLEELFEQHPLNQQWASVEGYGAINSNEVNKVTKTYVNGVAPIYKTTLWFGHELESTPNHQWFVVSKRLRYPGGETSRFEPVNEWVRTDELKEGYVIETKVGGYTKEEDEEFANLNSVAITMRCDGVIIKQPSRMNPDIAWFLGYLWGDGCMSPSSFRIRFTDEYMYNLQKVQNVLNQYFGLESEIKQCKDRNAFTLDVGSKMLWHWLIKNNIWKYYQSQLDVIPSLVRKSSKESIIAFIAGLIDSDGCVSGRNKWTKYTVYLSTAYDLFAQHLQEVALSVGLAFGRSLNRLGESKQKQKHIWNMTMTSYTDKDSFSTLSKHSNKITNALIQYPNLVWMFQTTSRSLKKLGEVKCVEYIGDKETFDIEVESSHYYYAGSFKSHNSISQLPGVSSGVHRPYAPYYFRNVRVSKNDPVAKALRFLDIPCHPENGQGRDAIESVYHQIQAEYIKSPEQTDESFLSLLEWKYQYLITKLGFDFGGVVSLDIPEDDSEVYLDWEVCNTWVFTFPVKTDAPIRSIDERAVDQLERYKQTMEYYTDHNTSITISVGPDEWDEVVEWLYKDENWNSFVGVSFLPRFDAENAPYPLMPYTSCTKEDYEKAKADLETFTEEEFQSLVAMFEKEYEEYELDSECSTGACPVR